MLNFFIRYLYLPTVLAGVFVYHEFFWDQWGVAPLWSGVIGATLALEKARPHVRKWNLSWRILFRDIKYLVLVVLVVEIFVSFRRADLSLVSGEWLVRAQDFIAEQPAAFGFALILFIKEGFRYWLHRMSHQPNRFGGYFWRTHVLHHEPIEMYSLSFNVSHPANIQLFEQVLFLFLLGPFFYKMPRDVLVLSSSLFFVYPYLNHSNLDIRLGPFKYILNGPELHRFHHDPRTMGKNLGLNLSLFDTLFGTLHWDESAAPENFGLPNHSGIPSAHNVFASLIYPFKAKERPQHDVG